MILCSLDAWFADLPVTSLGPPSPPSPAFVSPASVPERLPVPPRSPASRRTSAASAGHDGGPAAVVGIPLFGCSWPSSQPRFVFLRQSSCSALASGLLLYLVQAPPPPPKIPTKGLMPFACLPEIYGSQLHVNPPPCCEPVCF